jgi:cytochrome c oxidase assembly factor CtaG
MTDPRPPMMMSGPMWHPDAPVSWSRLVELHIQPVPVFPLICVILLAAYAAAVVRLRRRQIVWPVGRTISFTIGVAVLWMVTATGVEGYGMLLFSVHMFQHMVLTMLVPILLLLGAPVTLALRALPARGRGSALRRLTLRWLHSRVFAILSSLPSRWFWLLSSLYGVYFTPIFDVMMGSAWGHYAMLLHFLLTGALFFAPLVAADPVPGRAHPIMRMLELFVGIPFHAFFGIVLMSASTPIVDFFTRPPDGWRVNVLDDQETAGGIAWIFTDVPTLIVIMIIFGQWVIAEHRAGRHRDRRTRDHDPELQAYNDWLAGLSGGGPR